MASKPPMNVREYEDEYIRDKHDIVSISFQDEYGMRFRPTLNAPLFGEIIDIGVHPTNSSNPTEKVFSILIKKSKNPIKSIRIPKKVWIKLKFKEGDSLEYDIKENLKGLPPEMFLVFCSDTAKNEEKNIQKKNVEDNLPDWIKENYQSVA